MQGKPSVGVTGYWQGHVRLYEYNIKCQVRVQWQRAFEDILYWTATGIAGLIVAAVVAGYLSNSAEPNLLSRLSLLLFAGAIWFAGWLCRTIVAGREDD